MSPAQNDRFAVILLAMGGPASVDDVPSYLYNIFSDRSIIQLPGGGLLQKPFARLISRARSESVKANYRMIGGGSPLLKWTVSQAEQLRKLLQVKFPGTACYIGMRYFRPTIEQAIAKATTDGFSRLVFLPMYPQFCGATTGSSFDEAKRVLAKHRGAEAVFVNDFFDDSEYIDLLRKYVTTNIADNELLLFSAHSIPDKLYKSGDPYVDQTRRTAELVAEGREYLLSFQSRTGPVNWVGPDTVETVRRLLGEKPKQRIFIVPISFVCDHIETLYEIDIELKESLANGDRRRIRRMPMFNDDRRFAVLLAGIVAGKVAADVRS